jgi:predicted aminopeptidase
MRAPTRIACWALGGIVLVVVAFASLTPTGRYLTEAAWKEAEILLRRQPIAELIASPATDPRTRAKLELVLSARSFAAESIGLEAGESFTTFSPLESDTLVLVLSAAYRDRLQPYTWWFPIVGRVPYKGFFDPADARAAARALERQGLDTYLRPASAFSTLGWFNDPLVSTTLDEDSATLVNTVIHELTHNTFYAPGQAVFNESFANFVGAHGAIWYFRAFGDTAHEREALEDWARERRYGRFLEWVYDALDSAFARHPDRAGERLAAREVIFTRAETLFVDSVAPYLPGYRPGMRVRLDLNNATLLSRRVYRTGLDVFDAVLVWEERAGGTAGWQGSDLRRAIRRIVSLARSRPKDPYGAIRDWLAEPAWGVGR